RDALPAFFFGMITPYVIRLRIASVDTAGATVGRLYALSTAGSILGTFLGGFVLISWFGSTLILWGLAVSMLLLSLVNSPRRPWGRVALLLLCLFLAWQDTLYAEWLAEKNGTRLVESPYNSIRIMEGVDYARGGKPVRLMATDPGYSQSGMLLEAPDELYFDYTRYYALGPRLVPGAKRLLMLGGGGYSVPKWLLSGKSGLSPDLDLTVVELDPAMTESARRWFGLKDDSRLTVRHEDARAFLNRQDEAYDLVFVDVFNSHYSVPFQMGTVEAARALRRAVAPGGALVMNVISAVEGPDGRLFRGIWPALAREFPEVRGFCVGAPGPPASVQTLMLVALPETREGEAPAPLGDSMEAHRYTGAIPPGEPLRDDYAPVERYTLMLARQ
ncbi:MAG: fused MFS/spermidine synthase, partial [Desulfovibrio sp.]|nr:fused MFS/spermidine synthase [Desulfovibrio sp.]